MKHSIKKRNFCFIYRALAVVFTASLLVLFLPSSVIAAEKGSCGSEAKWMLEDGLLTIYGKGAMRNYTEGEFAPWHEKREEILSVVIKDGITSIGDMAFLECTSIQSINLPNSVISIGEYAFAGCKGLQRVNLNNGLISIKANAFNRCTSLSSIRLPEGLLHIGYQAFYLCESLSSIRIPSTVSNLKGSVFAYCVNLQQAIIECPIQKLPDWFFYGCTSLKEVSMPPNMIEMGDYSFYNCDTLETVYHDGNEKDRDSVYGQIKKDVPGFASVTEGDSSSIESTTSNFTTTDSNGSVIKTNKEVVETENTTILIETNHTKPTTGKQVYDVTIDATINGEDGWDEVMDYVDNYVRYPDRMSNDNAIANTIALHINLNSGTKVPSKVLSSLAGYKVKLTVATGANAIWTIPCEDLKSEDLSGTYDLNYTLTKIENPTKAQKKLIGKSAAYSIKFNDNIPLEVTLQVPLGYSYALHYATICHKPILKNWEMIQSVIIDRHGRAEFCIGSVDKATDYMVVIDMEGIDVNDIRIPDSLSDEYNGLTDKDGKKYVVTGTKSSWGISFGQLTLILVGVISLTAIVIGVIVKLQVKASAHSHNSKKGKRI